MPTPCWSPATPTSGNSYNDNYRLPAAPPPATSSGPAPRAAAGESLGDFYLYPLTERTTIANPQTKQVSFLDVQGAAGAPRPIIIAVGWMQHIETPASADTVLNSPTAAPAGSATRCRRAPSGST